MRVGFPSNRGTFATTWTPRSESSLGCEANSSLVSNNPLPWLARFDLFEIGRRETSVVTVESSYLAVPRSYIAKPQAFSL